ncbi:MAG: hypothetical protein QF384_06450 [Alphaproteobacteria bacterium]|jgi:hypothetical protein|nr:hypothetical protein [Alphaproteobacteria bacterium]MDP6831280.1 hypothetical protein [Alphaproteobacteria bacterium]
MFKTFEYCRYDTGQRVLQTDAASVRDAFAHRAEANGGKLFGCWRSLVGLGLARDEGLAITAWPDEATARGAPAPSGPIADADSEIMEATLRPTDDTPPSHEGVYVFRWFEVPAAEWQPFADLSDAAWPNMEEVFDVNICGFFRSLDVAAPNSKTLLLTRYGDLSVWEASRWWNNPVAESAPSMQRFQDRNQYITATIAYPTLPIF